MNFKRRTLSMALAGLLLGAFISGCGDSGDSSKPAMKIPEKPAGSPQVREILPEGQKLSQEQKPTADLAAKTDREPPPGKPVLRHRVRSKRR